MNIGPFPLEVKMDYEHRKLTQYPYPIGVLARMYPDMDVLSLVETSLRHETILDTP